MQNQQSKVHHVGEWASLRNTSPEIAEAIFEVAKYDEKLAEKIWEDGNDEVLTLAFEKTDKEEMARLVSYIHQQYDLAKEELEKIRQSQKKAADKHTGANNSANVRFTDS